MMALSLWLLAFGCIVFIAMVGFERNKNFHLRMMIENLEWRNRWLESQIFQRHKINMTIAWNDSDKILPEKGRWIITPRVNDPIRFFPYSMMRYNDHKCQYYEVIAAKKWAYLEPFIEAIKKSEGETRNEQ